MNSTMFTLIRVEGFKWNKLLIFARIQMKTKIIHWIKTFFWDVYMIIISINWKSKRYYRIIFLGKNIKLDYFSIRNVLKYNNSSE